jgi:hypothetical protein
MTWGLIWLMLVLKIPVGMLLYLVWWAVRQETDPETDGGGDGGSKVRPPRPPHGGPERFPRTRGPHGEPTPPSPARVRPTVARAREPERD